MDILTELVRSRAFLVALWALARAILSWAAPNIPQPITAAMDSLAAAVIAAVAIQGARNTAALARAIQEADETGKPVEFAPGMFVQSDPDDKGADA